VLGVAVIILAREYRDPAGRFPALIGGGVAILSGYRIVVSMRGRDVGSDLAPVDRNDMVRAAGFFVGLIALGGLIVAVGLVVGGLLWGVGALVGTYRWNVVRAAATTAIIVGAIGLVFPALGLDLPTGVLTDAVFGS
jgi:hypothetical protein